MRVAVLGIFFVYKVISALGDFLTLNFLMDARVLIERRRVKRAVAGGAVHNVCATIMVFGDVLLSISCNSTRDVARC